MGKRIVTGVIVILSVVLFLVGLHIVMDYHRNKIVAELEAGVTKTLQNEEVQKAAGDFLYRLYYSETANGIKGQVNNKVNHGLWTFLGAVEGIYGLRPAYVDRLKELYPEGPKGLYFSVDYGNSVEPNQYKFGSVKPLVEKKEEETQQKKENQPATKETPPAPMPTPDNAAIEETKKLLEGM